MLVLASTFTVHIHNKGNNLDEARDTTQKL
jgi:hypothetical protein